MKYGQGIHRQLFFPTILAIIMAMACAGTKAPLAATAAMSLADLFSRCNLQGSCDQTPPCHGQTFVIEGLVDQNNIFDKQHYPTLPYEKFRLTDGQGRSIEAWTQAADNQPIFDKLARRPGDRITVTGRLAAIKLPIAGRCRWGLKVLIDDPSQIQF